MIGHRSRYSLAQLLSQQEPVVALTLLGKYDAGLALDHGSFLFGVVDYFRTLGHAPALEIVTEVFSTAGDLRSRISQKYRFDERIHDLKQCLALDGYRVEDKKLIRLDPSIDDAPPAEDDLIDGLRACGAPRRLEIIQKIHDSGQAFRAPVPDYNSSLVNVRVALETLAGDICADIAASGQTTLTFDPAKWGDMLRYLRQSGNISSEEEQGLAGVFRFLSPGAHRPVGIPEHLMTRLGRSLALNMCWFLLNNHLAQKRL